MARSGGAERAVALVSGGIGSTVAVWAAREECEVALLHVSYGQQAAAAEAEAFGRVASLWGCERVLNIELPYFKQVGGSARVDGDIAVQDAAALGAGVANTHQPGLMPALLAAAYSWARSIGARRILVGASENLGPPCPPTGQLHPDSRREFFQIARHLLNLGAPREAEAVRVETPVIDLTLADIIRLGKHLEAPLHLTWSCYRPGPEPCQRCYGCLTRARAFAAVGMADPAPAAAGVVP